MVDMIQDKKKPLGAFDNLQSRNALAVQWLIDTRDKIGVLLRNLDAAPEPKPISAQKLMAAFRRHLEPAFDAHELFFGKDSRHDHAEEKPNVKRIVENLEEALDDFFSIAPMNRLRLLCNHYCDTWRTESRFKQTAAVRRVSAKLLKIRKVLTAIRNSDNDLTTRTNGNFARRLNSGVTAIAVRQALYLQMITDLICGDEILQMDEMLDITRKAGIPESLTARRTFIKELFADLRLNQKLEVKQGNKSGSQKKYVNEPARVRSVLQLLTSNPKLKDIRITLAIIYGALTTSQNLSTIGPRQARTLGRDHTDDGKKLSKRLRDEGVYIETLKAEMRGQFRAT